MASALSENGLLARVRVPGAAWLAGMSYSLYLTHKEAAHLLFHFWPGAPDGSFGAIAMLLAACLVVASALSYGVERPFLRLRERLQASRANTLAGGDAVLGAGTDPAV